MISLEQLKQLVVISNCNNISKASTQLFISQPALSRSMQRMEEDLGVILFDRSKNKVELNENGKLAVELSKKLLDDFNIYMDTIKAFDKRQKTISVGSCAPAPMWILVPELSTTFTEKMINTEVKDIYSLKRDLFEKKCHIIITTERIESPECITRKFCQETLHLCVPETHELARKKEVNFDDFNGLPMLLYQDIGSWNKIKNNLKNTRFIIQNDRTTFDDLISESLLPIFTTNISLKLFGAPPNRVVIPINEEDAKETFYITILKENKEILSQLHLNSN